MLAINLLVSILYLFDGSNIFLQRRKLANGSTHTSVLVYGHDENVGRVACIW